MGEEAKQQEEVKNAAAELKPEEKIEEKRNEKNEKEEPQPPVPLLLFVDLHCVGCAKKIERTLMRVQGVEEVAIDMPKNQVTIKGIVDAEALCLKIQKKTKRRASVASAPSPPPPVPEREPTPPVPSGLITIELNVNMHCEGCSQQLKSKILKMIGVQSAEANMSTGKVTVTGTMNADKLVEYVKRRTRKQARVVPQPEPVPEAPPAVEEKKEEEKVKPTEEAPKEEEKKEASSEKITVSTEEEKKVVTDEEGKIEVINHDEGNEYMKRMMYSYYQPMYVVERIPAPQLFSDENPNACCIS